MDITSREQDVIVAALQQAIHYYFAPSTGCWSCRVHLNAGSENGCDRHRADIQELRDLKHKVNSVCDCIGHPSK